MDYVIPTGLGDARNVLVATAGEAAIAIAGRLGTLSEIAIALKHGLPVVGLGTWKLDRNALFDRFLPAARSPEEAVDMVIELADKRAEERAAGVPAAAPDDLEPDEIAPETPEFPEAPERPEA